MAMTITPTMTVADIARGEPATIKVFQQYAIDFCCGGKIPLADACAAAGLDAHALVEELEEATRSRGDDTDWSRAPLVSLIEHIQQTFHRPLREELPRLATMMAKVVQRHGDRFPEMLPQLQATFADLHIELIHHMAKEDSILFPAIAQAEEAGGTYAAESGAWNWIAQPIDVMEAEHDQAGAALATMRQLTGGYTPPADACPTFRGLYFGLGELERAMHVHVHLENNILFPRAEQLVR
jgi:regulator of cell morphogenesis and NO signaling